MSRSVQARAQRHRQAVAALVARGRVVAVHGGPAAGGEQHRLRLHEQNSPLRMSIMSTPAIAPPSVALTSSTARCSSRRSMLATHTCSASRLMISMPVRSPLCTVRSKVWPGEGLLVDGAVRIAVEEAAELVLQLVDALDGAGHQRPGEILVGQPFAALDGVHEMALDRVARGERDVVAALHHARAAAFAEQSLHRDGDVERRVPRAGARAAPRRVRRRRSRGSGCRCGSASRRRVRHGARGPWRSPQARACSTHRRARSAVPSLPCTVLRTWTARARWPAASSASPRSSFVFLGMLEPALLDALLDQGEALVGLAFVDIVRADLHQVGAVLGVVGVRLVLLARLPRGLEARFTRSRSRPWRAAWSPLPSTPAAYPLSITIFASAGTPACMRELRHLHVVGGVVKLPVASAGGRRARPVDRRNRASSARARAARSSNPSSGSTGSSLSMAAT